MDAKVVKKLVGKLAVCWDVLLAFSTAGEKAEKWDEKMESSMVDESDVDWDKQLEVSEAALMVDNLVV